MDRDVIDQLGLSNCDLVIVCDGSGTLADRPCGGFAKVFHRASGTEVGVHVASSHGSNNFAELLPFVVGLSAARAAGWVKHGVAVGCVSDSEITVKAGQKLYVRDAHAPLWGAIRWYEDEGVCFRWKHVRRNSNPVNTKCDAEARRAREAISACANGTE